MQPKLWLDILEYARCTPTPHNTQPLRLKPLTDSTAEIYYDLARALPEGDPDARFALTAVGLFTESIKIAAAHFGYDLTYYYETTPLRNTEGHGLQLVARLTLGKNARVSDLPADLLTKRRTNRLPYNRRTVDPTAIKTISAEAQRFGHTFQVRDDSKSVAWVTGLNKRMVFYDLDEKNVRNELARWSRFGKHSAHATRDGLSAECLNVPGWGLWLFMKHYGLLLIPGLRHLLQWMYWQNMQGITTVAWIEGPFATEQDYLMSGHVLLRVWLLMAKYGIAYHPFGSVITNQKAHMEFVRFMGIDESDKMAWLLMRIGYSDRQPPRSERLPIEDYLVY